MNYLVRKPRKKPYANSAQVFLSNLSGKPKINYYLIQIFGHYLRKDLQNLGTFLTKIKKSGSFKEGIDFCQARETLIPTA